jgi:alpha-glucosidase
MAKTQLDNDIWWKKGVVYQIYPRSFMDSDSDGIGDIKGIISKLDYLNDGTENSLGVDALWISPFNKSPMRDFGYDISDYRDIDPIFGNINDFKVLLSEAHKRNIRIIMDLVLNHTSDEHPWFIESRKSKDNPKRDWYIWQENKGKRPNNWVSLFEMKNAWWLDEKTNEYYLGTFTRYQPEVNWRNPVLRKEMFDLIRYWLDMGVDGFRLDVVNWFIKDEELRDNPWKLSLTPMDVQKHVYDRNRPETHDICKELRIITDQYEERMLVGEIYTKDISEAVSYNGKENDELHMAFNFNFLFGKWSAEEFYKKITEYYALLPKEAWPNFTLSNHDQPRHYYRYSDGRHEDERAKVAAALIMTLKGTPFIYYGEEIGMTCERLLRKDLQDPLGKKGWPVIKGRDEERTPMQWDSTKNAGFSSGSTWLPVNSDYERKNVRLQDEDSESLFTFYKSLIWHRKRSKAITQGHIEFVNQKSKNLLIYKRICESELKIIVLNFSDKQEMISICTEEKGEIFFGTHRKQGQEVALKELSIYPYEVLIISM